MLYKLLPALVLLAAPPCLANIAAMRTPGHTAGGPVVAEPTPLVVTHEELFIACDDDGEPRCGFEARYHVSNPTAEPEAALAAFYGLGTSGVAIEVDGAPPEAQLGQDEARALDEAFAAVRGGDGSAPPEPRMLPHRVGLHVEVPAGAAREITVRGEFTLLSRQGGSYVIPAIDLRHPVLAQSPGDRVYQLGWLVSPIRTWAAAGPIELEVTTPAAWSVMVHASPTEPVAAHAAQRDGRVVRRATLDPEQVATLLVTVETPRREVRSGGPFLGVGTDLEDGRLLLRAGYDMALQSWLLAGVTVETDASARVLVAPLVEVTTPWLLLLPAASVGVGVPVLVGPDGTEVGVRFEPAITFPFVSVHFPIDLYPGRPTSHPAFFQASWAVHFSL